MTLREHGYTFAADIQGAPNPGACIAAACALDSIFASETLAHGTWGLKDFERLPRGPLIGRGAGSIVR